MRRGGLSRWIAHIRRKLSDRSSRRQLLRGETSVASPELVAAARSAADADTGEMSDDGGGVNHDSLTNARVEIMPGDGIPSVVASVMRQRRASQAATQHRPRSPVPYERCLKGIEWVRWPPLTRFVAFLVILNIVFMCIPVHDEAENDSCLLRADGNESAECVEADREYVFQRFELTVRAVAAMHTPELKFV